MNLGSLSKSFSSLVLRLGKIMRVVGIHTTCIDRDNQCTVEVQLKNMWHAPSVFCC